MKISGNMTMTKFDGAAEPGEPVAICLSCRGRVLATKGERNGWCEACSQEYEVSFIAVLKAVS